MTAWIGARRGIWAARGRKRELGRLWPRPTRGERGRRLREEKGPGGPNLAAGQIGSPGPFTNKRAFYFSFQISKSIFLISLINPFLVQKNYFSRNIFIPKFIGIRYESFGRLFGKSKRKEKLPKNTRQDLEGR
jgi:hypothetical protein